ncbi:MAG: NAD-dependent epimerase/dehydratase family protein [Clostridia bacterium]|nr:NAD-dependent epimerase/dehydratase family protein [Clostridia bacterium]
MKNLYSSQIYLQDLNDCVESLNIWERFRNKKLLITGAGGLVCSAVIDVLWFASKKLGLNLTIYAAGRNREKIQARFGDAVNFVEYDALKPITFNVKADYIIHGASNATPNFYSTQPVETMMANLDGIKNLLDFALKTKAEKIMYVSSSEVYGKKEFSEAFSEENYGFLDVLNPRSCYAQAKRASETLCASYKAQHGVDFNIVRLGHIYGPTALTTDNRVSSDFAFKATKGETIVMKSDGAQIRSYCHCLDCASAMITVLALGISGEAYNISNENSIISIKEMAQLLASAGNVEIAFEVPTQAEKAAFNPMQNSSLDNTKLRALGWKGIFSAEKGLTNTVNVLKQII